MMGYNQRTLSTNKLNPDSNFVANGNWRHIFAAETGFSRYQYEVSIFTLVHVISDRNVES